jgi:hypothetical protein
MVTARSIRDDSDEVNAVRRLEIAHFAGIRQTYSPPSSVAHECPGARRAKPLVHREGGGPAGAKSLVMHDDLPASIADFERALLRSSVTRLEAGRDNCRDCHRTPLVGERMYAYASGRTVCELCSALRPEEPTESHIVHGSQARHTVLRVSRAA